VKRLTLVRHAHADTEQHPVKDFDRPLSDRGIEQARNAAAAFAAGRPEVDLILSSPAQRAFATAEAFATALGYAPRRIVTELPLYLASPETILLLLEKLDETLRHVLVVGHNPGLSALARQLSGNLQMGELNTAAVYSADVSNDMLKVSTRAH
jgi:phosphohistidine phosphatase